MRLNAHFRLPAALFLLLPLGSAAVVDRVAIVIDKKVFTESEVLDDLRLTELINDQPLDLGPAARRQAAEHLVDQELIRRELEASGYTQPAAGESDALLRKFRQDRFPSLAEYRAAMQKYGVAEDQLKQRLLWQLAALRFTDLRFRSQQPAATQPPAATQQLEASSQSADRAAAEIANDAAATSVDQQMDAWLKRARGNAKIAFKQEAFQ
jgi:hypothetical protein